MAVNFLHFIFNLIIAGFFLRYAQMKLMSKNPSDPLGKALAFVY